MQEKSVGVFIGRFQPLHNQHLKIIKSSLTKYDILVLVIGSSHIARNIKNPFTYEERCDMISGNLSKDELSRTLFVASEDLESDEEWMHQVYRDTLKSLSRHCHYHGIRHVKPCLISPYKDDSSEYQNIFDHWDKENVRITQCLNASDIRDIFFSSEVYSNKENESFVPSNVQKFLESFSKVPNFSKLMRDKKIISEIQKESEKVKYPIIYTTTDCFVYRGCLAEFDNSELEILIITRSNDSYGAGQYALPGGYLEENLTLSENMSKELYEETGIEIFPEEIKYERVIDYPSRSLRGRIVSHLFSTEVGFVTEAKAGDDACHAEFMLVSDIIRNKENFFEDHFYVIMKTIQEFTKDFESK